MTPLRAVISDTPWIWKNKFFWEWHQEPTHQIFEFEIEKLVLKKLLTEKCPFEKWNALFFLALLVCQRSWKIKAWKNWGLLISRRSYNKRWGFQHCAHWEFLIWVEVCKVKILPLFLNVAKDAGGSLAHSWRPYAWQMLTEENFLA